MSSTQFEPLTAIQLTDHFVSIDRISRLCWEISTDRLRTTLSAAAGVLITSPPPTSSSWCRARHRTRRGVPSTIPNYPRTWTGNAGSYRQEALPTSAAWYGRGVIFLEDKPIDAHQALERTKQLLLSRQAERAHHPRSTSLRHYEAETGTKRPRIGTAPSLHREPISTQTLPTSSSPSPGYHHHLP